jgi:hypothetical protein
LNATILKRVLETCSKGKLMLGCRPVSSTFLTVAAIGRRSDVLFDCGKDKHCVHVANNVGWYYSDDYSWGFVQGGDSVNRVNCDTGTTTDNFIRKIHINLLSL